MLVSPIGIDDTAAQYEQTTAGSFDSTGVARSSELGRAIRRVAHERGTSYVDAAEVAHAGADGLHLTRDSHGRLAGLLATTIAGLLPRGGLARGPCMTPAVSVWLTPFVVDIGSIGVWCRVWVVVGIRGVGREG